MCCPCTVCVYFSLCVFFFVFFCNCTKHMTSHTCYDNVMSLSLSESHQFSHTHTHLHSRLVHSIFVNNSGAHDSADTTALTAYRVLVTFRGNSSFLSNQGGGISLLGSRMDIQGQVDLDSNFAVFGAGIAMSGRSLVSHVMTCDVN